MLRLHLLLVRPGQPCVFQSRTFGNCWCEIFFYSPSHHSVIGVKALEQWYHDKPEDDDVAVVVFRRWKRRDTVSQWFLRWCWTRSLDLCVSTTRTGWYSTRRPRTRTPCSAYSTGRRRRWRSSKSDIWHIPRTSDTLQMLLKIRHVYSLVLIWFYDNNVRIGVSHCPTKKQSSIIENERFQQPYFYIAVKT